MFILQLSIALQSKSILFSMPLFYQQNINATTKMAIWSITESLDFFESKVHTHLEITNSIKKTQHLAARYLLKQLAPSIDMDGLKYAANGKPYFENHPIHFSISHCNGFAACIINSMQPVGIDIELIQDRVAKVAHKFLHATEQEKIKSLLDKDQLEQYTFFWAAKEAMYKMHEKLGIDFSQNLRIESLGKAPQGELTAAIVSEAHALEVQINYAITSEFVWATCVV